MEQVHCTSDWESCCGLLHGVELCREQQLFVMRCSSGLPGVYRKGRQWLSRSLSPFQTQLLSYTQCLLPQTPFREELTMSVPGNILKTHTGAVAQDPTASFYSLTDPDQPWGGGPWFSPPCFNLSASLLRYNPHTIQFTHLKCPMQWLLSQYHNHHHNQFYTIFTTPKETLSLVAVTPVPFSPSCW